MKKHNKRLLAFVLALVMAFSTLVYVSATDGEESAAPQATEEVTADEAVAEEAAVEDIVAPEDVAPEEEAAPAEEAEAIVPEAEAEAAEEAASAEETVPLDETPAEELVEDDVNADLFENNYAVGDVIDFGVSQLTITANFALTGGSDGTGAFVRGTHGTNGTPHNMKDGSQIASRISLKIVPSVTGNIVIKSSGTNKKGHIFKGTDQEDVYELCVEDPEASTLVGFLEAGNVYYIGYAGTDAKIYSISFSEGNEPITEAEPTTETTTEAKPDENLEDINTLQRTAPSKADDGKQHTLWILGDSTACYYGKENRPVPRNGFGMALGDDAAHNYTAEYKIFDNPNLTIQNLAISGISSLDFRSNSAYQTLLNGWKEGDYVIIAFGHNDQKEEPARFTNASMGADGWNVNGQFANSFYQYYILPAVKAGVTPILATSIIRRKSNGVLSGSNVHDLTSKGYGNYRQTVIDLGKKFNISVLDNTYYTYAEHIALGAGNDDGSTGYAVNHSIQTTGIDNTHLNATGARMVGYFMAQAIQGRSAEIKYGVKAETPSTTTPILSDSTYASTDGALAALATFLGKDANTDPRTGEYSSGEVDPNAFRLYFDYAGDSSKLQVGDEFALDLNVANNKGISKVDFDFTYNSEEMTPVTNKDITDKAGNIIITKDDFAKAISAQKTTDNVKYTVSISADLSKVPATVSVTADKATLFSIPFKLVKRGEATLEVNNPKVYDPQGNAYPASDIVVDGGQVNVDKDITDPDNPTTETTTETTTAEQEETGLKITKKVGEAAEDGTFVVDYILSGNSDAVGINNYTLAVDYDPSKIEAIGSGNSVEVGVKSGDSLIPIVSEETINTQIALVPMKDDADYTGADGVKTAAKLGRIRLAGYLDDNDSDGSIDAATNNGILFSIKFKKVDASLETADIPALINVKYMDKGTFGNAKGEDITSQVEIEDAVIEETGIKGDIDGDGSVTANDAAALLAFVIDNGINANNKYVINDYVANVDESAEPGNQKYSASDAAQIMAKVLDTSYEFGPKN